MKRHRARNLLVVDQTLFAVGGEKGLGTRLRENIHKICCAGTNIAYWNHLVFWTVRAIQAS